MKRVMTMVTTAALTVLVGGCSTMMEIREDARSTQRGADDAAQELLGARAARAQGPVVGPIITETPYVDVRPTRRSPRYPVSFNRQITINEPSGVPIQTLAQRIEAMTGVRMLYQSELVTPGAMPVPQPDAQVSRDDSTLSALPPLPALPSVSTSALSPRTGVAISYTGDVVGLFHAIAGATGSQWEYNEAGQVVQFYRYKTETFRIPAVQGGSTTLAKMGGQTQSSGGQEGGGGPISMASAEGEHKTDASIWKDIEATIKQLVSPDGVYALSESTGSITIRDRPDRVEMVRQYLQETADALARQIDVQVTIYRVIVNDEDVRAMNWEGLFRNALGHYAIGFSNLAGRPDPLAGGLSSVVLDIPENDANGVPQRWGGSQVILDALSKLGRTSVMQNTSILTANNQPAPFKVVRRTSYLASVAQNLQGEQGNVVNTGPTLTPGSVETGLNLYVLPHVQDDGKRMLIKLMMSLSSLESLDTFGNEQASIQLPQVASREFQANTWLNSGETLVLAGFEQVDAGLDTRSPLDKRLWLLGGSSSAKKGREVVVVAIHPTVTAVRSRI